MKPGTIKRVAVAVFIFLAHAAPAQRAWFIDGYHGGVYGHYPKQYTAYITEQLNTHPDWKINLEIEPETWDSVQLHEPENLRRFQEMVANPATGSRIEFVSAAYGQAYLYNISGESIIRQFALGMKKTRDYFPSVQFETYSSEEPCFTSCLPQILRSFGIRYVSLKNPNTCWGGYVRAYGKQFLNWKGPDGTVLLTVPRYGIEALEPNSTWQTIAWKNSSSYLEAALEAGIAEPVGMTLQDAGWKNGPWLGMPPKTSIPSVYTTWRDYFKTFGSGANAPEWRLSQEDIQVSLVWGAQVLQRIAQQVRATENKLVQVEKALAIAGQPQVFLQRSGSGGVGGIAAGGIAEGGSVETPLQEAWRNLLLAQHHDCWIVPYNGPKGDRWIEKVVRWTTNANRIADSLLASIAKGPGFAVTAFRVFNTGLRPRSGWVTLSGAAQNQVVKDAQGRKPEQYFEPGQGLHLYASVPGAGYTQYYMSATNGIASTRKSALVRKEKSAYIIETDQYRMTIDTAEGGNITSLIAKKMNNREWVAKDARFGFNGLRGLFSRNGGWQQGKDRPAQVSVRGTTAGVVRIDIRSEIAGQPFEQTITLRRHDPLIDMQLKIDWNAKVPVGDTVRSDAGFTWKPFYDDRNKLLLLFPLNLRYQQVYKNAPFDVTQSSLGNTFFSHWDSIKNNIILNWADVYDSTVNCGLALFSDHTTTYSHGGDSPLGLTVQYAGPGLWGRDYTVEGPTTLRYALLPHVGRWDAGGVEAASLDWNEPLLLVAGEGVTGKPLLSASGRGWELVTALREGDDLLLRVYNAAGNDNAQTLSVNAKPSAIIREELNGQAAETISFIRDRELVRFQLAMPRFGIRTVRLKNVYVKEQL